MHPMLVSEGVLSAVDAVLSRSASLCPLPLHDAQLVPTAIDLLCWPGEHLSTLHPPCVMLACGLQWVCPSGLSVFQCPEPICRVLKAVRLLAAHTGSV